MFLSFPLYAQHIFLAEDDEDDYFLFEYALKELNFPCTLTRFNNGEALMQALRDEGQPVPGVLFLDLNMPRKNGKECLLEIKALKHLELLPVIVLSTSISPEMVNRLYNEGAKYCIRKPEDASMLREIIYQSLTRILQQNGSAIPMEEFALSPEFYHNEAEQ